ncbi:MAG TPA: cell division protein FtsZ [Candidatus Thermoplasmatota archaeon]|nr:cell division protein FtsZ [Candidatus Thermoplasmatota archaeon]
MPTSEIDQELEALLAGLNTKIKVVGCGGGGCNTIMRLSQSNLENVELIACNTDAQHLLNVKVPQKILIGRNLTRGLGAGAIPDVGKNAAEESEEAIRKALDGADLVFVTAGMGGGTGTGSAPVVAEVARDLGALTIAVVTTPFGMEGHIRAKNAESGLSRLRDAADTTVVIPNDKLLEVAPRLPLAQAFRVADEILMRSIRGLTEMITKPGLVNLDFADLKTVMKKGGVAMIGVGEAEGDQRAREAIEEALTSPLLDVDVSSATGCLVDVAGGPDMTLEEAQKVVQEIHDRVSPDCRIIWGANVQPDLGKTLRAMVVLTGVRSKQILGRDDSVPNYREAARPKGVDFVL